jgi:hypothetical protein
VGTNPEMSAIVHTRGLLLFCRCFG